MDLAILGKRVFHSRDIAETHEKSENFLKKAKLHYILYINTRNKVNLINVHWKYNLPSSRCA